MIRVSSNGRERYFFPINDLPNNLFPRQFNYNEVIYNNFIAFDSYNFKQVLYIPLVPLVMPLIFAKIPRETTVMKTFFSVIVELGISI